MGRRPSTPRSPRRSAGRPSCNGVKFIRAGTSSPRTSSSFVVIRSLLRVCGRKDVRRQGFRRIAGPRRGPPTSRGWVREGLLGVLLGVGILVFAAVLFTVLEPIIPASTPPGLMPRWGALLYGFALISAFAPIEEVVWRGYAITVLRKHVGVTAAVLMSSIAFGAMHWWGGLNLVVASTAAGLLYSGLFLWRRNLLGLIVAHFTSDFPLLVFMLLGIERPT